MCSVMRYFPFFSTIFSQNIFIFCKYYKFDNIEQIFIIIE